MKTTVKIFLLVLCSIGAIAAVLMFAKTQIAPPSNITFEDQYRAQLDSDTQNSTTDQNIAASRSQYLAMDDKLKRYRFENAIDDNTADEFREIIDETYGTSLTDRGFQIFSQSTWPQEELSELLAYLEELQDDKLSNGERALSSNFITANEKIHSVVNDYQAALKLSQSTGFTSVEDSRQKLLKAKTFRQDQYLKNNTALMDAINAMPKKLADAHYNYVSGVVNNLANYRGISDTTYDNLITRADNAIREYKAATIYGSNKQSIVSLENKAADFVEQAMDFYYGN